MKLKLHKYSKNFPRQFEKEKRNISKALKELKYFKIYHVGSTSVPGLGGKGIIDILIGIKSWPDRFKYIQALKKLGFKRVNFEEKGRISLSKIWWTRKGDVHIHLVGIGTPELTIDLKYRNLLRKNKTLANKYWQIKKRLIEKTKGNRKLYGKLKSQYIRGLVGKGGVSKK